MALTIRNARRKDVQILCRLVNEMGGYGTTPEQMEDRLDFVEASPFDSLYVCEEGGTVVGFFGFRVRENIEEVSRYGEVSTIAVVPEARGRGIGRFMMGYAEGLAEENGCEGMWLVSGLGRKEAHRFYWKLGYEVTGYRFVKRDKGSWRRQSDG